MKNLLFILMTFFVSNNAFAQDSLVFVSPGRIEAKVEGDLPLLATIRSRCLTVASKSECLKPVRIKSLTFNSRLLQSVGVYNPQAPSFAMLSSIDQIEVAELKDGISSFGSSDLLVLYKAKDEIYIYGTLSPEARAGQYETFQVHIKLDGNVSVLTGQGVIYVK
jgi:hypothetical protein